MRVYDDAELVFDIKNVPATTNYDIVIRYEPQVSNILFYKNYPFLTVPILNRCFASRVNNM